ncbi:putative regulatory protein [Erwinia amylovora MR1]|nr:putative regulatory protein [Erwinia amylovora MR1]
MTVDCIINHWSVDFASGTLLHKSSGEQRRLGEYQLKLLRVLAENAGKTVSREELNHLVWERRVIGNNSLPNAIHALRIALEDDGKQQKLSEPCLKRVIFLKLNFANSPPLCGQKQI